MLRFVDVYTMSPLVPPLRLALVGNDGTGPFHIRDIEGLGSVKAEVNSRGYGLLDGEYFTGTHIGKRNIVMTLGLNPASEFWTMGALRKHLLGYLRTSLNVILEFTTDEHPIVRIEGYVESFDAPLFTKDPEIQISIICPKPYFVSKITKSIVGLAKDNPLDVNFVYDTQLTDGIILQLNRVTTDYYGPINVEMSSPGRPFRKFEVVTGIYAGSYYQVNSHQGSKTVESLEKVTNLRVENLLRTLTSDSLWPYVVPGTNTIRVKINSAAGLPWIMYYNERFGGI